MLLLLGVYACAGAKVTGTESTGGHGDGGAGAGGSGNGGSGSGGSTISFADLLDAAPNVTPPDTRKADLPPDVKGCHQDDAGNWLCCPEPLHILSFGQPATYGADSGGGKDNTDAFQNFMNSNTGGTATMTMVKAFSHIADLKPEKYDLIILQALYTDKPYDPTSQLWKFTDQDAAALQDWVNNGGALITMSGYFSDTAVETQPLNQLLKPLGISYNGDDIYTSCPDNMCYCTDNSIPFGNWNAAFDELTHDLRYVGVFHGRSIECSGDCQIMAMDSTQKLKMGVAKTVGKGRVFAWSDEWVTYTSQWGLTDGQYDSNAQCAGHTAKTMYSVPQFWYNVIRWVAPDNTCFTIIVPPTSDPTQQIIP